MIPVIKRSTVFAVILCISLFIPVMNARVSTDNQKKQEEQAEVIDFEDTQYHNDENDDLSLLQEDEFDDKNQETEEEQEDETYAFRTINDIIVSGNKMISKEAILNFVPFRKGDAFDPHKTSTIIHNLYTSLKRFKNIQILGEFTDNGHLNVHIVVEEKPIVKDLIFKGNNNLAETDIRKKIDFDIPAIDEAELKKYALKIQKLYREKNYHRAVVEPILELDEQNKARVIFNITEGKKTLVNRILFAGNKHVSGRELRKILYTREDWILGFLDNAGGYLPEKTEADRHLIETYYQNNGFFKAKVVDAEVIKDACGDNITLIFHIEEGDCFTISEVTVDGQGILNEEYVLKRIPVQVGDAFSREKIGDAIKALEMLWGDFGYIYAHVEPGIIPDEETRTIKVSFETDLGSKVFLNKLNIIGNRKTRDRIIRRRLLLEEGSLLTHFGMEESKNRVSSMGYFDVRDGVNWKLRRIDSEHADLDLIVKEVKTGHANLKLGFGGSALSMQTPGGSASLGIEIADTNLFGSGLQFTFQGNLAKDEQNLLFNLTEPWLFDKPILGAFDMYHRRPSYDELRSTEPVNEILTGGSLTCGFVTPILFDTQVIFKGGIDSLDYQKRPISLIRESHVGTDAINLEYQSILDREFQPVDFVWFALIFSQDKRNNPMHPSRGVRWLLSSRFGIPSLGYNVGFHKLDLDFNWWTPLIGENDLVLHFRTYLGVISHVRNHIIPYRELFHIGGPATVRGWLFGQLSPLFLRDSIGGKKALFVNLEMIFPITPDFNTKALVFYDGGCGWDNPYTQFITPVLLSNNCFNYRHSVGVGLRMLSPAPVRIDWGFKLDRRKRLGEPPYEVHFGMTYDW